MCQMSNYFIQLSNINNEIKIQPLESIRLIINEIEFLPPKANINLVNRNFFLYIIFLFSITEEERKNIFFLGVINKNLFTIVR